MIIYFSATGNCQHVANRVANALGDRVVSMTDLLEKKQYTINLDASECLGIVSPTYAWKLPLIVEEFLEKLCVQGEPPAYVFYIATYGTTPGQTGCYAEKLLAKAGIKLDAAYGVKMPDNWTPTFDLSNPEKVSRINAVAEGYIDKVIGQIQERASGNFQFPRTPHFTNKIAASQYEKMRETRHFVVEDSCIGCGICASKCPAKVIKMEDGKPAWKADKCYMCLGCLHRCPTFAIQYENRTKKHGQYLHPSVKGDV